MGKKKKKKPNEQCCESQHNCTYTYKYLKEKTKTSQPKLAYCGLWEKKKNLMNNVVKVLQKILWM